ncbi:hypothetical protein [Nostoc sp. UHCC 0251]|uniref:hypothetical protein n=1 Tax=Nostoc sp. UHCC 0251 TaxID=3110240 RepID=UPI002B2018C1|nr:hypothetical protein [Nostoc sp. UHCC 0251]MEA5627682.1 hypothetical protein [Nostoc sp. UHCC 0251]
MRNPRGSVIGLYKPSSPNGDGVSTNSQWANAPLRSKQSYAAGFTQFAMAMPRFAKAMGYANAITFCNGDLDLDTTRDA